MLRNSAHSALPCRGRCASPRGCQRETPYPLGRSCQPEQRRQGDGFRHPRGHRGAGHGGDQCFFRLPASHPSPVGRQWHPARLRQAQGVPAGKICPSVSFLCDFVPALFLCEKPPSCFRTRFWVVDCYSVVLHAAAFSYFPHFFLIIIKEILT